MRKYLQLQFTNLTGPAEVSLSLKHNNWLCRQDTVLRDTFQITDSHRAGVCDISCVGTHVPNKAPCVCDVTVKQCGGQGRGSTIPPNGCDYRALRYGNTTNDCSCTETHNSWPRCKSRWAAISLEEGWISPLTGKIKLRVSFLFKSPGKQPFRSAISLIN